MSAFQAHKTGLTRVEQGGDKQSQQVGKLSRVNEFTLYTNGVSITISIVFLLLLLYLHHVN